MKVSKQIQIFILIFVLIVTFSTNAKAQTSPVNLRVVNAPQILIAGQSHVFTIEIQNTTDKPLTLSLLPGFRYELFWMKGEDIDGGVGKSGNLDSYDTDPQTGRQICRDSFAKVSDFFTLQAKESRKFEIAVDVPEYLKNKNRRAIVCFSLQSACEGKNLGFAAWVGDTMLYCADDEIRISRKKRVD
jgi:hypothetical protein